MVALVSIAVGASSRSQSRSRNDAPTSSGATRSTGRALGPRPRPPRWPTAPAPGPGRGTDGSAACSDRRGRARRPRSPPAGSAPPSARPRLAAARRPGGRRLEALHAGPGHREAILGGLVQRSWQGAPGGAAGRRSGARRRPRPRRRRPGRRAGGGWPGPAPENARPRSRTRTRPRRCPPARGPRRRPPGRGGGSNSPPIASAAVYRWVLTTTTSAWAARCRAASAKQTEPDGQRPAPGQSRAPTLTWAQAVGLGSHARSARSPVSAVAAHSTSRQTSRPSGPISRRRSPEPLAPPGSSTSCWSPPATSATRCRQM